MQILNIAGYKFTNLADLLERRNSLLDQSINLELKGTILLSSEGINVSLAGTPQNIERFISILKNDAQFSDMTFRESYSTYQPFNRMQVKIKNEIITLRQPNVNPAETVAPAISPREFKQWLDEKRDITVLDTRNEYEMRFGTFEKAKNLELQDFGEFPEMMHQVSAEKPIVMFCTGGIRCEKAALVMLNAGYKNVYQLQGGILNYFAEVGGDHYQGECFVFDQRVSVDTNLESKGTQQCLICQGPVKKSEQTDPDYIPGVSCPTCVNQLK
jgi:UPF0176 protein